MEYITNSLLENTRNKLCIQLIVHFNEDLDKFKLFLSKNNQKNIETYNKNKCIARVWDQGLAQLGIDKQCSKKRLHGNIHCLFHNQELPESKKKCNNCSKMVGSDILHKFQWEHHGNFNEAKPRFYEIEKEKYEKKKKIKTHNTIEDSDSDSDGDSDIYNEDDEVDNIISNNSKEILSKNLKSLLQIDDNNEVDNIISNNSTEILSKNLKSLLQIDDNNEVEYESIF